MPDLAGHHPRFHALIGYLARIPGVEINETPSCGIGSGLFENGTWWVKFAIDISHPLAWHVVQECGYVLNYLSASERLPTVFKPVSPPPYLNGGPRAYLSWLIECPSDQMTPDIVANWLQGRLPRPVDDMAQWEAED